MSTTGKCRLTGCKTYENVQFQGRLGKLILSNEKILFQCTEDASTAPRTWLWKSMKKYQVVLSADDSEGKQKTHEFLGRRIDGVMKFEKAKAQFLNRDIELPSLTRFLGRLRYPSR